MLHVNYLACRSFKRHREDEVDLFSETTQCRDCVKLAAPLRKCALGTKFTSIDGSKSIISQLTSWSYWVSMIDPNGSDVFGEITEPFVHGPHHDLPPSFTGCLTTQRW